MAERVNVLLVGAGAAGGVAARRLAEAGMSVVCLEQGDWPDREAIRGNAPDWELVARKRWSSSPAIRRDPADYPLDLADSEMAIGNYNGVGGGTVLFNGVWPRLRPGDFRVRSLDGVADDWPVTYEELLPFYERTDRAFGVSGLGGNPAYPPGADPPLPPLPIGAAGLRVARAHARLGWHWWPEYNAILSAPYDGRHPCVQRGTCPSGCNQGAKGSTDVTHWPVAVAGGVRLVTGARVSRLPTGAGGLVTGAEWVDRDGRQHFQGADVVLLAANAVGTARLLLLSAWAGAPDGLANSSGLVGRRLMLHPCGRVLGYFDDGVESWQGQFGGAIQTLQFYGTTPGQDFVRGAKWSLAPTGGPVGVALPRPEAQVWGAGHHDYVHDRFGRGTQWIMLCEDLPDPENRVELSPSLADPSGIAAPKLVYRLSGNARRMMAWHMERAAESLTEAGAGLIETVFAPSNSHVMGTARMGEDPATSVVDRWGMTHDVANLGIIDGSVFVTAGAVNPTSTIAALALRATEHLIERRAGLPTAEPARSFAVTGPMPAPRPLSPLRRSVDPAPPGVSPELRSWVRAVADVLIPAAGAMPSAAAVGVADGLLDWVLAARPDLAPLLERAHTIGSVDLDPGPVTAESVAMLSAHDPEAHEALLLVIVAGYYHHDEVRRLIGYPGQVARTIRSSGFPEYIEEGLLDHLF